MKARNPSTGNLETVYVKALDSMPVGTEVDFDGQASDIPTGWEQVDNILWTNPNPTSAFAAQTVSLDNNYDCLEIVYRYGATGGDIYTTTKIFKGNSMSMYIPYYSGGLYFRIRHLTYNSSGNVVFEDGKLGETKNNGVIIPLYIIGYKTGLFD